MADEQPATPPVQKPASRPIPRPAGRRATNAGPVRAGVTPANSPAAIPAIMRGPVAPLSAGWRAAATGAECPEPTVRREVAGPTEEDDTAELDRLPEITSRDLPGSGTRPETAETTKPDASHNQTNPGTAHNTTNPDAPRNQTKPDTAHSTANPGASRDQTKSGSVDEPGGLRPDPGSIHSLESARFSDPLGATQPIPRRGTVADARKGTPQASASPADLQTPGLEHRRGVAGNASAVGAPSQATRRGGRVYSSQGTAPQPPAPGLLFRPIVQVADVAVALAFFEHLGAELIHGGPDADYVLMQLGTVQIGLVGCQGETGPGAVELNFSAALPLDELERRLRRRRVAIARGVHPTVFGPQLHVRAPDGLLIKIGQLEPDDYL